MQCKRKGSLLQKSVEHASFQTFGSGDVSRRVFDDSVETGARLWDGEQGSSFSVEAPEGGGAPVDLLDADGALSRAPLRHSDEGEAGARGRRRGSEEGLPGTHRDAPLPQDALFLLLLQGQNHPAHAAQCLHTHLLQTGLSRKTEQDRDQARDGPTAEALVLELS